MGTSGSKAAGGEVVAIKLAMARVVNRAINRVIQVHGEGTYSDAPLIGKFARMRAFRVFEGPDEVHLHSMTWREIQATRQ